MTLFSQILQYAISGMTGGSIYAVLGICWSVVYLITKVLNFTTGEFVMLGGMLTWGFYGAGLGLLPASLLAVAATIAIAVVMERTTIRSVRQPSEMVYMMLTIALASILKGIILLQWGSETRKIEPMFGSDPHPVARGHLDPSGNRGHHLPDHRHCRTLLVSQLYPVR